MTEQKINTSAPVEYHPRRYLIWAMVVFFAFFQFLLQSSSGLFGADWQADFHLDETGLGNFSAAFFYSYLLMQIPVGLIYDRFPPKYILVLATSILGIGCILFALTPSYIVAIFARLLMGASASFAFIGVLKIVALYFEARRFSFMVGLSETLAMSCIAISLSILAFALNYISWRTTMLIIGGIAFLVSILYALILEDKKLPEHKNTLNLRKIIPQVKTLVTHKSVLLGGFYGFFSFALVNAFTSLWGVRFFVEAESMAPQTATSLVGAAFVGIALGCPVNGWIGKRFDNGIQLMRWQAFLGMLLMSTVLFIPHLPVALYFVLLLLAGFCCSSYIFCFEVVKDVVDHDVEATAMATTNMIIMSSALVLQPFIGYLLEIHSFGLAYSNALNYRLALSVLPLGLLIAFLCSLGLKHKKIEVKTENEL